MAAVAARGLPDTLVPGDVHPGNTRGVDDAITASTGATPASGIRGSTRRRSSIGSRERIVPGADPRRALALLAPVAAARMAAVYQGFLARIEPSEHGDHRDDPRTWLRRAAAVA